jgi:hypothetical protein
LRLFLAVLAAPLPSFSAEPSKTDIAAARDLFSRAERDEDRGLWADAVDKLRRAGSVKMTPGIRFHIALCEEKLGQLALALEDYATAEAAARSEGNKEVLEAIAESLAALRVRVPTVTVTLPTDAGDAKTTLDGVPLANELIGTAIPVDAGSHIVSARAVGRPPFSVTVSVNEKEALTVEVRFPSSTVAKPFPAPGPSGGTPESSSRPSSSHRAVAIATTAGAVAFVGFGTVGYFIAGMKQSSAETQCLTMPSCDSLKTGVRTWDALALGAWIAGAGVGALSIYLWTRPAKGAENPAATEIQIGPGSLRLAGQF